MSVDCVVVGFNEIPMEKCLEGLEKTKRYSGSYRHTLAQTVYFKGKRRSYSELIVSAIENARNEKCELNVFQMPSFAVNYLVTFLRRKGINAEAINYFNYDKARLKEILLEGKIKLVAISTSFYTSPEPIKEIIEFVRQYNEDVKIIAGGTFTSGICVEMEGMEQEWMLDNIGADIYINDFQGETALSEVCKQLISGSDDLSNINNLIYKDGDKYIHTIHLSEENSLEDNHAEIVFNDKFPITPVLTRTSRSCANRCSFCRYPIVGGKYCLEDLKSVEENLDYIHSLGVRYVIFVDDTFNIPLGRFKDICRLMIRKKYNFRWFSYFRCSDADEEAFNLMQESGCAGVFLGIESGDPQILKNMNKKATIEQYAYGIEALSKRGIMTLASFMIGFPGETEESVQNTINFIKKVKPTFFSLQIYFHETRVPIDSRKEEFGLKGKGYSWHHNTMDWKRASEWVYSALRSIRESINIPLYSFNIWSVAYYLSQGITKEQIIKFLKLAQEMNSLGLEEKEPKYEELEKQIIDVFKDTSKSEGEE